MSNNTEEMTTLDALRELRSIAASIVVDNGNYAERLLTVANWIEHSFAKLLAAKSVTFQQAPWPESEAIKVRDELIKDLQVEMTRMQGRMIQEYERWESELVKLQEQIASQQTMLDRCKAELLDEED